MSEEITKLNEEAEAEQTPQEYAMRAYDIKSQVMGALPNLELTDAIVDKLLFQIKEVIMSDINSDYFVLMSPHFKYLTIFKDNGEITRKTFAKEILQFILEEHESLGNLKDFSLKDKALELWIGNECYMLFSYKNGVIEI